METGNVGFGGILIRSGLVLLGLIFGLIGLETGARVIHPTPDEGRFYRSDPATGWSHIPGAEGWFLGGRSGKVKVWVRINSRGLYDREIPYLRNDGGFRILALGDSMTAGLNVALEETFAKILEQRLNRNRATWTYEVINAGVNGYGTDNELLFYRYEGAKYRPDLVLLMFSLSTDVVDNYPAFKSPVSNYAKPHFVLESGALRLKDFPYRPSIPQRLRRALNWRLSQSKLYRFASYSWDLSWAEFRNRSLAAKDSSEEATGGRQEQWERAWALTRALLHESRREVEEKGATLVVVIVPPSDAIDPDYWEKAKHVKRRPDLWLDPIKEEADLVDLLQQDGFRFVSLRPALKEGLDRKQPPYFDYDLHWNANGHRIAAEAIRRYLVEESLLSGPRP